MTLHADYAAPAAADREVQAAAEAGDRPPWSFKNYLVAALIVAATVAAIVGFVVWAPNVFASAPGGCGGG